MPRATQGTSETVGAGPAEGETTELTERLQYVELYRN